MRLNADFDQRVLVHSEQMEWLDSPMVGVARRPLDRVGDEVARATSVVKYQPSSYFSPHIHTGGEEFLVLEGVFQDEHGDYPAGSYCRNPPQSRHTPGSELGCVILVKLWQFHPDDRTQVSLDSDCIKAFPLPDHLGISVIPLYSDDFETVSIETWQTNTKINRSFDGGAELFVLDGSFTESGDQLVKRSWLRLPVGSSLSASTGSQPARVWIKRDHLVRVDEEQARLPI